jgi:hypothetical protein
LIIDSIRNADAISPENSSFFQNIRVIFAHYGRASRIDSLERRLAVGAPARFVFVNFLFVSLCLRG